MVASIAVFLQHIKQEESSSADVSDIFSPACYKAWKESREGELKNPEKAFFVSLVAHVRGTDARKPFPEIVEKSILQQLRKDENVWSFVFPGNVNRIGKRGFKHLGYHEKRRKEGKTTKIDTTFHQQWRRSILSANEKTLPSQGSAWMMLQKIIRESKLLSFLFDKAETNAKALGVVMYPPALVFFLSNRLPGDDWRLNLMLTEPLLGFDQRKPVGKICFEDHLTLIKDCNEAAKQLLGKNIKEKIWWEVTFSLVEHMTTMIRTLPLLLKRGEFWRYSSLRKADGSVGMFLTHQRSTTDHNIVVSFQEVSHLFQNYLQTPFFI